MKGAIPLPYIIAIIFGIIIIAIIGYWFFTTSGGVGGSSQQAACQSAALQFCLDWIRSGSESPELRELVIAKCGPLDIPVPSEDTCKRQYT